MADRTRAATYEDALRSVSLLEGEGVEYALVGGYALAWQSIVRLTDDVDILVEPTAENARRWVRALAKLPDGAARELEGGATLHEEPYAIHARTISLLATWGMEHCRHWPSHEPIVRARIALTTEGALQRTPTTHAAWLEDGGARRNDLGHAKWLRWPARGVE